MEDKKAKIWDNRNKSSGEPYKKYVIDPILFKLAGSFKGKVIVDQGCGNGYLALKVAKKLPKKLILVDLFPGNLDFAKRKLYFQKCETKFIQADLNYPSPIMSDSVDIVISSMVLPEIKNYQTVILDTHRILKNNGIYLISLVHPIFVFKKYLEAKFLKKASKISPPRHYFDNGKSKFILGLDTHKQDLIEAPHYNRTVSDYLNKLTSSGFIIESLLEPKVTPKLLEIAPRFKNDKDCPISLIIKTRKSV